MSSHDRRVAIVTGGASGLGKAIAQRLVADHAQVVITDVQTSLGEEGAAELGITFLQQDVTDEAQWNNVIRQVYERHGGLHMLVNNAGIFGSSDLVNPEQTTLSDWRRMFAVNVESVFLGCRAAIPAIRACGGGSIINISSVAGLLATPHATAYGASKAAVRQLTKSVAQYCAQENLRIRCNSVHPGDVRTPQWEKHVEKTARDRGITVEEKIAEVTGAIPLGELTLAEDVAAIVSFLASDDARHITGAEFIVDGGFVNCDTYLFNSTRRAAELRSTATLRDAP